MLNKESPGDNYNMDDDIPFLAFYVYDPVKFSTIGFRILLRFSSSSFMAITRSS
jgi:hypothetical protein